MSRKAKTFTDEQPKLTKINLSAMYTKPDEIVIWQYYTASEFDFDDQQKAPTQKQFAEIANRIDDWELFREAREFISNKLFELQQGENDA